MAFVMQVAIVLFMAGTLLAMGLGLTMAEAATGLSRRGLLVRALVAGFVAGPALAWSIALVLPISAQHATGLYLLALAPSAPFLPGVAERAGGTRPETAAVMLVLSVATVVILPFAVPLIMPGVEVSPAAVARPLVTLVLAPLALGIAVRRWNPALAGGLRTPVAHGARISGGVLLVLCLVRYGRDFLSLYGGFGFLALLLFQTGLSAAGIIAGRGLPGTERTVLTLAMTTRNVGASLTPLVATAQMSGGAALIIVLAIPVQLLAAEVVVRLLNRARREGPAMRGRQTAKRSPRRQN